MIGVFVRIKEFFLSLFALDEIQYIDLLDEYKEFTDGVDFSALDTLVGTVRSKEQYEINLLHCFYHIPERYIENPDRIRYVALYRSKNIFGDNEPGIKHCAKVLSFKRVKRCEISELKISLSQDEYYYRFDLDEWKTLELPVIAKTVGPNVCLHTNRQLLLRAKYFTELYIDSAEKYILHLALTDITNDVYGGFFIGENKVRVSRSKIIVITPKKRYCYKISDYKKHRVAFLDNMYDELFHGIGHV